MQEVQRRLIFVAVFSNFEVISFCFVTAICPLLLDYLSPSARFGDYISLSLTANSI